MGEVCPDRTEILEMNMVFAHITLQTTCPIRVFDPMQPVAFKRIPIAAAAAAKSNYVLSTIPSCCGC